MIKKLPFLLIFFFFFSAIHVNAKEIAKDNVQMETIDKRLKALENENLELKSIISNYDTSEIIKAYQLAETKLTNSFDNFITFISIILSIVGVIITIAITYGSIIVPYIQLKDLKNEIQNSKAFLSEKIKQQVEDDKAARIIDSKKRNDYFYIIQDFYAKNYRSALSGIVTYLTEYKPTNETEELSQLYYLYGCILADTHDYVDAISYYNRAIELNITHSKAYNNRGIAYVKVNKHQKAIKDYSQAIFLDQDFMISYFNRGISLIKLKKYEEAIKDLTKAISLDANVSDTFYNRGIAYGKLNKNKKAIDDYTEAIRLNPKHVEAYNNRANLFARLDLYQKAMNDINRALKYDDFNYYIYDSALEILDKFDKHDTFFEYLELAAKNAIEFNKKINTASFYNKYYTSSRFQEILAKYA